ncbi:MAG: hypothetical protein ACFB22_10885 [Rhodothalassiaceae bacterium]
MFHYVRLELGRTKDHPDGSAAHGYILHVPLDADHHIDREAWSAHKKDCRVTRFWPGEPDQHGQLIHTRHRSWAFSYEPGEDDDEPIFHLEQHRLAPGDYITIRETDGESLPFKVVSARPSPGI